MYLDERGVNRLRNLLATFVIGYTILSVISHILVALLG